MTLVTWLRISPSKEDRVRVTTLTHLDGRDGKTRCGRAIGAAPRRWEGRFPREAREACHHCLKYVSIQLQRGEGVAH